MDDVSFRSNYSDFNPAHLPNTHEGKNSKRRHAWFVKCKAIDLTSLKFVCDDYFTQSMLIRDEYVWSICEFSENQFLISVAPTDLLVVSGWTVLHTVVDPVPGNIEKFWLSPLP